MAASRSLRIMDSGLRLLIGFDVDLYYSWL